MINYSIAIMSCKPGTKKTEQTYSTKAYGTSQIHESLDLDAFCKHIADHNSPFSKGTVKGILTDAVSCLREQLLAGNKVCEGADTTDEFNAQKIKEVNVVWLPGKEFRNLRADAEFNLVPSRKAQADAIEVIRNEETIQGLE